MAFSFVMATSQVNNRLAYFSFGDCWSHIDYNRQFNASVIDELCKIAREKYDLEFDNDGSELQNIYPKGNKLIIVLKKKSNIIHLKNAYTEEESIIDGFQSMFELDDDKIFLGIMTTDKKREELHKLRTDRNYLREYLRKNEFI